jgi:predicted hydrocarbon binding protein
MYDEQRMRSNMTITRHISLDEDRMEKIRPYVEKHSGNFGNALREIINMAGKYSPRMNSSAIDISLLNWVLTEIDGMLLPVNILDGTINPALVDSIEKLEEYLKKRFRELEWDIDLALKYDQDSSPSNVLIELKGPAQKIKFVASLVSQYLVINSLDKAPLKVKVVSDFIESIRVELERSNKKEAKKSLTTFFGGKDEIIKIIKSRPAFWKAVISRHQLSNYNMVTIHRNYFEDMFSNKIPLGEITIENLAKKPIQEISLREMLSLIKEVYETARVADRVEIDNDTLTLFHSFRNKETMEKLKKSMIALLEANGHLYEANSVANMIIFRHRPDVGIRINEIVEKLKNSHSSVDQELIMFMAFLKGFKELPDIPLSLTALGRRIGKSLMQEYQKENSIKVWNLETFQKALEIIDSRLNRESEWKIEGKNMIYTIKKCALAREGNTFDTNICHTARESFKGAMNYAFGNKVQLDVTKLVTHGDNFCEVMIRIP